MIYLIPQYHTILDKDKAKALGVSISDAYKTLQLTLGSYYVNDFNLYGRTYQVKCPIESKLRRKT